MSVPTASSVFATSLAIPNSSISFWLITILLLFFLQIYICYYNNIIFINYDVTFLTRINSNYDTFKENIKSIDIPDCLTNHHTIKSVNDFIDNNSTFINNSSDSYKFFNDNVIFINSYNNTFDYLINY